MGKIKFLFSMWLLLLAANLAFAQKGEVTGVIKDAGTGEPIPFASVMVKGTMIGVAAGSDGAYSISVPDKSKSILLFSSVGYKDLEVKIEGKSIIDVKLRVENVLEDVVVVAYGTQKKEAVTGSVSSVKGDGLAEAPVTSVDKMLSGKLAGVDVGMESGSPGAFSSIRIRGISSINAGNNPLWVIDGIPVEALNDGYMTSSGSTLTMLNPSDIETISVLKDAAAASAYGSRAANGVILVTTKSGKAGKAEFNVKVKCGVNWLQSDSGFRMMNSDELLGYYRQAAINGGYNPDDPNPSNPYYFPMSILEKPSQNWLNVTTRLGKVQEYEISGRGGNSKSKFYTSVSYQKNQGIVYGVDFDRLLGRINASYKLLNNLEAGVNISLGFTSRYDVPFQGLQYANPIFASKMLLPWVPAKVNGEWNKNLPTNDYQNPRLLGMHEERSDKSYSGNSILSLKWTPFKNLVIETKNNYSFRFSRGRWFKDPKYYGNTQNPQVSNSIIQNIRLTTSNTATYSNLFGGFHSFRAVLGQEAFMEDFRLLEVYGQNPNVDIPYLKTTDFTKTQLAQDLSKETLMSYFLIMDYNFDNRYFLQANIRTDGSSLFGSKRRWGTFWSVAGSWNVSRESFWGFDNFNMLKVRLSYGVNGNNNIANYRAFGLYSPSTYNGVSGLTPSQPSNEYLSWEKNRTFNIGLDFGFLNNRLTGSVDFYNRITEDMLLDKYVPFTTGWGSVFTNVGSLRNRGLEVQLNYDIINNKDFNWSLGGNISMNRSLVLDIGASADYLGTSLRRIVKGRSLYSWYVTDYYGVNPANGEPLWVNSEKDGKLILTNNYNDARKTFYGSSEPKVIGGFNTSFSWKGLSLSAYCDFKAGFYVWMGNEDHYMMSDGASMNLNQKVSMLNYWKKPGDVGVNPKPIAGNTSNSNDFDSKRYLYDGSYLRIKDVTLSYSLSSKLLKPVHLRGLKFYISGLNLFCFNGIQDFDPELGPGAQAKGVYPLTKSIVGGIELSF